MEKINITVEATINASVQKAWECWTEPKHITQWYFASDDWHAPFAENDLRIGGVFVSRMEAKDKSFGFDFGGTYNAVKTHELISYEINGDNRKVKITFDGDANSTKVIETFEAETENPVEMQQAGWQAILNNFKKYVESL
jgi:uncharacterized protein YndB with AHSA1/START domain